MAETTTYKIIDGRLTAARLKQQLAAEVEQLISKGARRPRLVAVLVGHDPASEVYVRNKRLACEECGIDFTQQSFEDNVTERQLIRFIHGVNNDKTIDGLIVQLPLPEHIDTDNVINAIDYRKDVDGFHPVNVGRIAIGQRGFISATPLGIMTLFKAYGIETSGKRCVILGRSNIVGSPMARLMMNKQYGNATVTVCHRDTPADVVREQCRKADIIITAIGQRGYVKRSMVKQGVVVMDVGMTRVRSRKAKSGYRLAGDFDFAHAADRCSFITPVPGGVGPMTVCALMQNTLAAYKKEYYP